MGTQHGTSQTVNMFPQKPKKITVFFLNQIPKKTTFTSLDWKAAFGVFLLNNIEYILCLLLNVLNSTLLVLY